MNLSNWSAGARPEERNPLLPRVDGWSNGGNSSHLKLVGSTALKALRTSFPVL